MAYEDLELDISSDDWTRQAQAEAKRDTQMEEVNKALDNFFERLEFGTGCARLNKADRAAILGVGAGEGLPHPPPPDPWKPVLELIKSEREKIRQQPTVTKAEVRSSLVALSHLFGKVAAGGL